MTEPGSKSWNKMSPAEKKVADPVKYKKETRGGFIALVIIVMFVAGCVANAVGDDEPAAQESSATPSPKPSPSPSPSPKLWNDLNLAEKMAADPARAGAEADTSAARACRHFYNIMGEIDVLSVPELREKLKEVNDDARYSETQGIPEGTRAMLAAITADDGEALLRSTGEFYAACNAGGVY